MRMRYLCAAIALFILGGGVTMFVPAIGQHLIAPSWHSAFYYKDGTPNMLGQGIGFVGFGTMICGMLIVVAERSRHAAHIRSELIRTWPTKTTPE